MIARPAQAPRQFAGGAGARREAPAPASARAADRLPEGLQTVMEAMSGFSLADVIVHRNSAEPARLGAAAFTKGDQIHVAPGQERHLPHEAWHAVQQKQGRVRPTLQMKGGVRLSDDSGLEREADSMAARAAGLDSSAEAPRRTVGSSEPVVQAKLDALSQFLADEGGLNDNRLPEGPIEDMSYNELRFEADKLRQWLSRQTSSSPETGRTRKDLDRLEHEIARRDARAYIAGRRKPRTAASPLPARRPHILTSKSSRSYTDPTEMREEHDLIMLWLGRPELSPSDRAILETARANLDASLDEERERVATKRHAARVRRALSAADSGQGDQLARLARTIEGIAADEANSELFHIYHQGERIPISRAQRDTLLSTLRTQLTKAHSVLYYEVEESVKRYKDHVAHNKEFRITSFWSGLAGGASDPGEKLTDLAYATKTGLGRGRTLIAAGRFSEASTLLPQLERNVRDLDSMSRRFVDDYMRGAGRIVTVLEVTRNVSFAVAGGIAAVVAAPFVAGAVGVSGVTGTGLTILGTGAVVGGGTGLVRGGSAALGVGLAGGSAEDALAAFEEEGASGAREGFLAGAGGAAARALAPLLGVGTGASGQALRRIASDVIVNSSSTFLDRLVSGDSPAEALEAGLTSGLLAIPGGAIGGNSRLRQELAGPLLSSATAYYGAIDSGATLEEARRAATTALAVGLATGRAMRGRAGSDARYEQAGRRFNAAARQAVAKPVAATWIGLADALPPARAISPGPSASTQPQAIESATAKGGSPRPASPEPDPATGAVDAKGRPADSDATSRQAPGAAVNPASSGVRGAPRQYSDKYLRQKFRREQEKALKALPPDDPVRKALLDESTGRIRSGRERELERAFEAGHADARSSGLLQRFFLQDADANAIAGQMIESRGALSTMMGVEVRPGVYLELGTARQMESMGELPPGTVSAAQSSQGWIAPARRPK